MRKSLENTEKYETKHTHKERKQCKERNTTTQDLKFEIEVITKTQTGRMWNEKKIGIEIGS